MVKNIFKYTTTLGIRENLMNRYTLSRTTEKRQTPYGEVTVKKSSGFGVSREKVEYEEQYKQQVAEAQQKMRELEIQMQTDSSDEVLRRYDKLLAEFDRLGCFAYSAEEGTRAAEMENQLDEQVKADRGDIIMQSQNNIFVKKQEAKIGKTYKVMVQASPESRLDERSLNTMFVRTASGELAPVSNYLSLKRVYGSDNLSRFNLLNSICNHQQRN